MARRSPVRDAVRRLLVGDRHGWSIDEMVAQLGRQGRHSNRSTVFRALVTLQAAGEAQRVDLGDGVQRYEATGEHHEHIRCERCGAVEEIPGCLLEGSARVGQLTGFEVTDHRLVLSGLCPRCQSTSREELLQRLMALR